VSEYFKDIDEDVLVLFGEMIGDGGERGMSFYDSCLRFYKEYDGEEFVKLKNLIDEDYEKFKMMYILEGVVNGWVMDLVMG